MKRKSLIKVFQEAYPKARPYIATVLVAAISTAPAIDSIAWRVGVTAALAVTILFLIFDLFNNLNKRLDTIDSKLKEEEPPTYNDFPSALPFIKEILTERLLQNKDVSIKILGVSAQFSWKNLIELTLPELFNIGHKKPKISVEIVIVNPSVLHQWGQELLKKESENTLEHLPIFKKDYKNYFNENRVSVDIWQYDNIPHWHGVLIDNDIFFMGRCKWKILNGTRYRLEVGQKEYRQFTKSDRFRGEVRIELFEQWFDAYKFRSQKTSGSNDSDTSQQPNI
jgi:hypothetical protein